jgi:hypothetical protein
MAAIFTWPAEQPSPALTLAAMAMLAAVRRAAHLNSLRQPDRLGAAADARAVGMPS